MTPTFRIALAAAVVAAAGAFTLARGPAPAPADDPPAAKAEKADPAATPDPAAAKARAVLKASCHGCHRGPGSSSGQTFDVLKYDSLVRPAKGDPVVSPAAPGKPGDPDQSQLWEVVENGRMPPAGSAEGEKFGEAEAAALKAWLAGGAKPFGTGAHRPFVPLQDLLAAIDRDLLAADPADQPYLRYFTLTHVHNNPEVADEELAYLRAALSKVLNSLSWKQPVVVPRAVDPHGTVFAVDLREVGWDAAPGRPDRWRRLADAYPYGLKYGNKEDLRAVDARVGRATREQLPYLRADWFVATASRPPLYHDLLDLPANARDLEARLKVDIPANFRADKLRRAGFQKSGVSDQNRLVERHETAFGAYWKSYDFFPDAGRANLSRFPLGPAFDRHPFPEQAFRHDGGEVIFHLPNGLQAYLLVNSKDERIDAGPIDIVHDNNRTSGTPAIVNGVSCMGCHKDGMLPVEDVIREANAAGGEAAAKVLRLYPKKAQMNALLAADRAKFLAALDQAVGPFLKPVAAAGPPQEPVTAVAVGYRRAYLDAAAAAAELYEKDPAAVVGKVGARRLKELGVEQLAAPGGVVGRYQWEAADGPSLMQEVAAELGYTPVQKAAKSR